MDVEGGIAQKSDPERVRAAAPGDFECDITKLAFVAVDPGRQGFQPGQAQDSRQKGETRCDPEVDVPGRMEGILGTGMWPCTRMAAAANPTSQGKPASQRLAPDRASSAVMIWAPMTIASRSPRRLAKRSIALVLRAPVGRGDDRSGRSVMRLPGSRPRSAGTTGKASRHLKGSFLRM
ncbi:MAG: hypothetical protein R2849_07530 [Thermomicrobiales bacterium]